jgi:DNA-binding CsgD family transcriptional regulator
MPNNNIEEIIKFSLFLALLSILFFFGLYISTIVKKRKKINFNQDSNTNEAITEVKELAQKKSTIFYLRFTEIYTNFDQLLATKYPQLSISDKTFLAMIFLNFSNKEIASIESVSLKTIEIRKYRIRKKCNLEHGQDIKSWLDDLAITENK